MFIGAQAPLCACLRMFEVYLAVGSNLGDRLSYLKKAQSLLKQAGIFILRTSSIYETAPVGGPAEQAHYLNVIWKIKTILKPAKLLKQLVAIEKKLGRCRSERNAPRTIDLDILFYEDKIIEDKGLTIPHPKIQDRRFVLEPLAELCPRKKHPVLKKSVAELLKKCTDKHAVKHYEKNF